MRIIRRVRRVNILPDSVTSSGTVRNERCQTDDGVIHTGPGCTGAAARHLIAIGVPPSTQLEFLRDGKPVLLGTVHAFAIRAWGGVNRDPFYRPWAPHPDAEIPPKLAEWYASTRAKGKG